VVDQGQWTTPSGFTSKHYWGKRRRAKPMSEEIQALSTDELAEVEK